MVEDFLIAEIHRCFSFRFMMLQQVDSLLRLNHSLSFAEIYQRLVPEMQHQIYDLKGDLRVDDVSSSHEFSRSE